MIKILIIDNNDSDLIDLNISIEQVLPDADIITVDSLQNGCDIAIDIDPDIIIMDIYLARTNVFGNCLKDEKLKDIPLLFVLDKNVDALLKIKAIEIGAEAFISKPIDKTELLVVLNTLFKIKASTRFQQQEQLLLEQLVEQRTHELKQSKIEAEQALHNLKKENKLRNYTESKLQSVLQQLQFHKNNSPLAVIEFDNKGIVTDWSNSAEKIFGWSAEEVVGKGITDFKFVYEDDMNKISGLTSHMIENNLVNNISINKNYCKDGSVITCQWYISILTNDKGEIVSAHTMALDISKRIKVESEKERLLSDYAERIRELNCIYSITNVNKKQGTTLKSIMSEIINLIPISWRHSEDACGKIEYNGKSYKTDN